MDASRLRQEIARCFKDILRLKDELAISRSMARGLVYVLKRKCGKDNCRCVRGKLHSQVCLAWGESGKKYLRPLKGQEEIDRYKKLTRDRHRFRKARTKFIGLSKRIVELSNKLEQEMLKKGDKKWVSARVKTR